MTSAVPLVFRFTSNSGVNTDRISSRLGKRMQAGFSTDGSGMNCRLCSARRFDETCADCHKGMDPFLQCPTKLRIQIEPFAGSQAETVPYET